jgi:hypothetical protein
LLGTAPALFWLASSLLVSHYVYDLFPLYDLNWVCSVLSRAPQRWINIHCGLDKTSALLAAIFPDAACQVVDIFNPLAMTETSIRAARRVTHHTIPSSSMQYDSLAFPADWFDAAFAIFAAHELRHHDQRVRLLENRAHFDPRRRVHFDGTLPGLAQLPCLRSRLSTLLLGKCVAEGGVRRGPDSAN